MDPLQRMIAEMKTATRITDRKNAAQSFINYLNNDEDDVCETLDFNSVNPEKKASDRMTWTRLFAEVRDYFVKETEKGTMTHLNKLFYFSVIDQVFTKATSNRPWLQWSKVYDFILTHLQKDRHAALYGPSLISMLERFLSIEFYGTVIDATAWIELTNIILKCYKKYEISTVSILRCLNHCIARGSLYGQVISTLRSKVVNFYTKILQDDKNAIRQDIIPYLQGLTTLCALNAFEFRSILCKLGEDVIPQILQISSFSDEEETALIDFLMVQYRLHMPCDVDMNSDSFYAYDPQNWKEILRSVYSYCIDKIEDTAYKRNSLNKTDLKVSEELIQLAANCTKQISSSAFTENEDSEEGDGVLQKKKMRYKSFDTIINDVSRRPVSEGVLVWTSYLSVVLSDFPELVGTRPNLSSLIQLGNSMFNTSFINRREFYVYFLSVLLAEKYLLSQDVVSSFSDSWNTVWDLCIKSLSVCEDKSAAMQLLRNILKEIRPANIMSLLNLYMNNSMPPMECSLLLLADCLALCSLPVQLNTYNFASQAVILDEEIAATSCPRQAIIAWLMNASNQCANGMESLIATLMCSLVVKQSHTLIQEEIELNPKKNEKYLEFEKTLMKCCFVRHDTKKGEVCNKTAVSEIRMPHFKFIMKHRLAERLADALDMGFKDLPTLTISSNAHNVQSKYKQFISKLNLYLNIANIIDKYSMWENEGFGLQPVVQKIFDLGMLKLNNFIHECFTSELVNHPQQIAAVIKSTRVFMSNKLTVKMQRFLSSKFNQPTLEHLKKVFRSNLARYVERSVNNPHEAAVLFSDEELPSRLRVLQMSNAVELELITKKDRDCEKASTESLHALIEYGMICNHPLEFFNEILKDLHMEPFLSANQFLFDACADVIFKVSTMLPATGLEEIVVSIVGLLQKCCRGFFQLPYCAEKLWTLFKDITRVVAPVDLPDRTHFMILVGTLYNFLKAESKVTSSVYLKAFECFSELAKHDPSLTWTEFIPRGSAPCWVLEELHLFLKNQSHLIRMCVADTICNTYQHADPFDYSGGISSSQESGPEVTVTNAYQDRRKSFLKTLYTALLNTFDIECGLSPDEIREESVNRTSLALSCLTRLIFAFPYLQKQSIMNVFVIVKVKSIDVVLAQRALQYSSSSSTKTMCCYLSYILSTSLKLKHTVEDLPYQFFGSDNLVSFLTKFRYEICVEYFEQDKMEDLRKFAARFNTSVQSLTQECYGMLMARLTPGLAIHQYGLQSRGGLDVATFNETHKRLISELGGKDATETLMMTCLGDVVLNLISLTFDPVIVNEWGCLEVKLTEPVPPHYPETTIETCLKFLQAASPHSNVSVIGYLAKSSARSIYKILLALTVRIHEAHNDLEKYWRLHQLSFFINLLLNEPQDVFSSMKEYVCNFVFNTYLRLLKTQDGNEMDCIRFQQVLILLITKLVERITEECTDEMIAYFNPVVRGIVSAVVKYPVLMDSAKRLLDFLMKTHSLTFVSCIASLEPFPSSDVAEFQEYDAIQQDKKYGNFRHEWPLQKELEMCLKEIESSAASCTKERLRFLKDLLAKHHRKRDLERMVRNLETKRFSEECDKDPLHHIIQMLIGVTLTSHNEEVILEASRCLGEIGPVDLSVLVLPTHTNQVKINTSNDALIGIIKIIFSYITSDDIRLVTAAGEVLRNLFEYEECADLAKSKLYDAKLFKILLPFRCFQVQRLKQSMERIDTNMLETKLGLNEMNEYIDFRSWITGLSAGVIACFKGKFSLVAHLLPLCELRVDFCEDVLPYIVYLCLLGGNPIVKRVVTGYFRNFFSKFTTHYNNAADVTRSFTPSSSGTVGTCIFMNKLALRSLLRVIQFLRRHPMPQAMKGSVKLTPWDSNFWLDLNYLDVAKVAQFCGAYLTSILYVEIAATEMDIRHGTQQHYDDGSDEESQEQLYSQGLSMYSRNRSEVSKIEKLLLKAYTSIGEADATYGCGSARFTDVESSMHHMEQSMDWHRLLVLANGSSFDPESCQEAHVALSLKQQGLFNVLWAFLKGTESGETESASEDDITQVQYECGWRLTKWNMNADKPVYVKDAVEPTSHTAFQVCIYEGIQAGLGGDTQNQLKAIKNGFRSVQTDLRHATLESSENICPFLSRLQMLRVVEDFFEKDLSNEQSLNEFVNKWKQQDRIPASDFKYQEPILFLRNVLLREYNSGKRSRNLDPEISESLLELISKARDAGRLDFADNLATAMASICKTSVQREFEVAKTNWARGKGDVARHILSRLIRKCNHEDDIFPSLLLLYGDWVSISHSERPSVILEKYLQRSCNLYEKKANAPLQEVSKANFVLAKYADAQYQNVSKYIGSEVFTAKQNHLQQARMEEENMKHLMDLDSRRSAQIIRKQSSYDDEEINYIYKQRTEFLMLALRHYLRGLKASHEQDLLIFRAISLWLENGNDTDEKLVQQTTQIFGEETMPTYKYIVVLHQLSARLSNKSSKMNDLLKGILVKCAEEHPYHTLPVILTQASLHKDENLPKKTSNMKVQLTGRVKAAHDIVESLKANKRLKTLLVKMETVWVALIELANTVEAKRNSEGVKKNIPESIFKKFVHLEDVAVPTSTIPVLPSGNYTGSVVGIHQFGNAYGLVGGINSPKKIDCRGTNGLVYNMLLKGQDDLRQDAVMQQVFGVINKLLQAEPKTRARQLHIRTYKVIPLSQRTGLIEWVENTQTLGDYLVGPTTEPESGAHPRYRPNDYKPIQCRHLLLDAKNCGDIEKKFSTYIQICEHFKPVFRHFFFENFKEAGVFFEKRLAYTRSVATNSIVGYILGLGDRHVLNILIDKTTAEFIHIDLGVAFEQGRILPTPETIPFRLTRDVIDGMGVCGIEGVFKKSCEMTMEVLRNNAEIILTVLQVLLYDPLYMWALTNDRVAKVQPSDTSKGGRKSRTSVEPVEDSVKERNNSAARVLLRLRQKLMGIEEEGGATGAISSGSSLSIDGHVSLLIQRAMDPEKLSRLFPGWQPYL